MKPNFTFLLKVFSTLFILAFSDLLYAQIPNAPVAKPVTPGVISFNATWSTVTEATGYQLDVSLDNFSTFVTGYNSKTKTNTADFISGLAASTTYKFRVRATNASGTSANSNVVEVTTGATGSLQTVVPKAGKNLSATGFTAEWNTMAGATGYQLDISADNFATFLAGYNSKSIGATSTEIVTGLTATTTYQYRLRTVNGSGISANSSVTNVTTLDANPNFSQLLDVTFDTDGKVTTDISTAADNIFFIAIQSDGKIVAAGNATFSGVQRFAIVRYNTNGSLDNTFGTGGIVTTAIPGSGADGAGAVAIQSDGKIVAAGYTFNTTLDFAVVRYNANGTLDTSFDTDGIAIAPIGVGNDVASAIVIQTDGKIVLAGRALIGAVKNFGLARFNANGTLDNTFDTDGVTITAFGTTDSEIKSIAIQTDGKILAVGSGSDGFALARYNTNGSLDNTFDVDGKITSDAGAGKGVVIQSDGKILAATALNKVFGLVRYAADGTLDNTFGIGGKVITQFVGDAESSTLVLQPDGKIIVAGWSYLPTSLLDFALARYNTNGTLDSSFGTGGKIYTDMGSGGNTITSLALLADGKIIAGGIINAGTTSDFGLARYDTQAGPDTTAPSLTITSTTTDPTNVSPIPVTFTFSEAVTGFDVSDITIVNGTAGNFAGSGAVYTASITPINQGAVTISVAASKATDAAANGNTASSNFIRVFENVVPTVVITSTASNPTNVSPITFIITFSEPVINFTLADITVTNGTASNLNSSGAAYAVNITPTAAGTITISVAAGTATDAAANNNTASNLFSIVYQTGKLDQTITFATLPSKQLTDAPFALTATASSGLSVSYTSSNTAVATISGATVTIVGAGTTTITADQAGDANFNAAISVTQNLVVEAKQNQTITFAQMADKTLGDAPFTLTATASSALAVSYGAASDKITISGSQVTIVKAGRASIKASQAGNATFNAANSVEQSFCIKPAKPTIAVSGANTETLTLTSNASAGNQWFKNDVAITGATNTTLNVITEGIYKVHVKADDCVSVFSDNVPLIVTGDLNRQLSNFTIYPNPVEDDLNVLGVKGEIRNSQLLDMTGRSGSIHLERREDVYYGNAKDLSPGVYVLRVVEGNSVRQIKFIKK